MSPEDIPAGVSAVCESDAGGDLEAHWEAQWKLFVKLVRPYEADRSVYRTASSKQFSNIVVHPLLWRALVRPTGEAVATAVQGFLILGFIPLNDNVHKAPPDANEPVAFRLLKTLQRTETASEPSPKPRVSFDEGHVDDAASNERIRQLESEVRDLSKQLRFLRLRDRDAANTNTSACDSPTPPIPTILTNGKPIIASTGGNSAVCFQLNYLDPDVAPFVVSLADYGGRQLLPCQILERCFVVFIAAPHPAGSVSATLLCTTPGGGLRKYCRAVWLEYREPEAMGMLSHHAVNQLMGDIPLPSSTTAPDPSESAVENNAENEVDATEDDDQYSEFSVSASTAQHPPLTREMLEMLQLGRPLTCPAPPIRRVHSGNGSECSDQPQPTQTSQHPETISIITSALSEDASPPPQHDASPAVQQDHAASTQ